MKGEIDMNEQLKNDILRKAEKSGCDSDGDIIQYGEKNITFTYLMV